MATVYLSSPQNQMQAAALVGMPVLLSFALDARAKWLQRYIPTFDRVVVDSGAYSEMSSGKRVDLDAYGAWLDDFAPKADAAAALDDIRGDWKRSLANWDQQPHTFPSLHDSDPPEYIDAVLERLQDSGRARLRDTDRQWVGIGLVPPRRNHAFVLRMLRVIPQGVHVHCFALRTIAPEVLAVRGPDVSFDSTNWLLDARAPAQAFPWLTPAECVEIIVKRYQRVQPTASTNPPTEQTTLGVE
jgi:hypothetical protein